MAILAITGLLVMAACGAVAAPPKWPDTYNISGILRLPYAEINEPFSAWYEVGKFRSRVDYYNGSVKTMQFGKNKLYENGTTFKVAPVFMNDKNDVKCFQVNGTQNETSSLQSVLPDLSDFQEVGIDHTQGEEMVVYQKVEKIGQKKNKYTMWMTKSGQPRRYEMMGYDTLLGSHYDKYYIDYDTINNYTAGIDDSVFTPPKDLPCGSLPGPGSTEHIVTMNPMNEYIHSDDSHIDNMFNTFKKIHNKQYDDYKTHEAKKHQFRQNVRYIHSKNRAGLTYTLGINHMADLSSNERTRTRGFRRTVPFDEDAIQFSKMPVSARIPNQVDWRLYGAVTPVKDQAVCGSCWSFGTVGTIEGAYFLKTGELVRLSQQELIDCSWDQGNNGCDGGEDYRAYQWIKKYGLATAENYGSYIAQDGVCRQKNVTSTVNISGYVNVTSGDRDALKQALSNYGPISVAIDASHKSLSFYANGVYYEPECKNDLDGLDHAVLAVGYGVLNRQAYWLIKNSWSTYWGNDGYVLMSMEHNNCGVATTPTFVLIDNK